ncbi:MAG: SOS cell division inhibitor SulA [Pseudomonadota bacterium]
MSTDDHRRGVDQIDPGSGEPVFFSPDVWRGNELSAAGGPVCDTGYPALNALLPGGGWPVTQLLECLTEHDGVGELRMLLPALARLAQQQVGWIVWIAPPYLPNAPALLQWGLAPERMLVIHPRCPADAAWAAEQALTAGTCIAVLLWADTLARGRAVVPAMRDLDKHPSNERTVSMPKLTRRLQVLANKHQCWPVLMRHAAARKQPSAAPIRVWLSASDQQRDLHLLKVRGGRPGVIRDFDAGIDQGAVINLPNSTESG